MREFFEKPAGRLVAIGLVIAALGLAGWTVYRNVGSGGVAELSNSRTFVDAKTGLPFTYKLVVGEYMPVVAPSGGKTGYPSEQCWWTKEGSHRSTPFYVILNDEVGKSGPTFCPDCGRLVVFHNPSPPEPTAKAPPTEEEFKARRSNREDR